MGLFEHGRIEKQRNAAPLAGRMRPKALAGLVGQDLIVGEGRVLRRAIEADQVPSMVLWGPPGSGKTTLAHIVAGATSAHFEPISAVTSGVADLRRIVEKAQERMGMYGQRTILFIDEIHRFNKAQQDVVLPFVEDGTFTLIGATTENPSFEVIPPLLSRCRVFTLQPLGEEEISTIVQRALRDEENGLGALGVSLNGEALQHLVSMSNGDARTALNGLEASVRASSASGGSVVDLALMEDALQRRSLQYDKAGDLHYDTISAFIKSVRGSSPDGAMYWLVRMIESGEDPMFIARRLVILAAEDIGLADPAALTLAVSTQQAVHFIGMPEGAIPLAEATIYLASAPKSNSAYVALNRVRDEVRRTPGEPVPMHLRNAVTGMMSSMGYGKNYKYGHDYEHHFVEQDYLPPSLKGRSYYEPSEEGQEKEAAARLRAWWAERSDGA